jgi:hypothetical protein
MPPHPELVPRSRVPIPEPLLGPIGLTAAALIAVAVLFRAWTASIERLIKRLESEITDLRAEKAHVTAIVDTFPPIIADLTDEIRQSHGRGAERWEGNERRRERR